MLLALSTCGNAVAERLPLRFFTAADGLPGDQVEGILADDRGFLWFSTLGGLSRFDGDSFTHFAAESGLPTAELGDLLQERDGTFWLATANGLCRFRPSVVEPRGRFACATLGASPATNRVQSLFEDAAGTIWAGTSDGLFRLTADRSLPLGRRVQSVPLPVAIPSGSSLEVAAIAEDADGDIWVGTFGGVVRLSPLGEVRQIFPVRRPLGTGYARDNNRVFGLLFDRAGRLWIGLATDGVVVLRPASVASIAAPSEELPLLASARPAALAGDGDGSDGSDGGDGRDGGDRTDRNDRSDRSDRRDRRDRRDGGRRLDLDLAPGEARQITHRQGLAGDWARNGFLETTDGVIWIGTVQGLSRFADGRLTSYGRSAGLVDVAVRPEVEDSAGNLWLSSEASGAMRLARRGFESYVPADGIAGEKIAAIGEDREGRLFATTLVSPRVFLNLFVGGRFRPVAPRLPAGVDAGWGFHQTTFQDRDGVWWVATGEGLLRFPAGTRLEELTRVSPTHYTQRDGLGGDDVFRLFEDRRGDLWIGSFGPGYLTRRDRESGRFENFGAADGLPESAPTAFAEDRGGGLWISFYDGSLARFHGGNFAVLPAGSVLPSGFIHAILVDRDGRLWITSRGEGAARLDTPEAPPPYRFERITAASAGLANDVISCLTEDAAGRIYLCTASGIDRLDIATGRVAHFSTADGLASNVAQSAFRDRHGDLWFATYHGLSRLTPRAEASSPASPVWLTELRVNGVPRPLPPQGVAAMGDIELQEGSGSVELGFVAPGFAAGERLRYEHRVGDDPWSAPSEQHSLLLAGLGAGRHRLEIRAVDAAGASTRAASVEIEVQPPLVRRGWFQLLVALAVLGAIAVAVRLRIARLVEMERIRTRIASDLHDDLGASLSRISILSEVAARRLPPGSEASATALREIGGAARGLFDTVADIVWAIDPRRDDLRALVARLAEYAGDLVEGSGVAWSLEAPAEAERVLLATESRRHLYLLLKEALHNAVRHAAARSISLRVRLEDGGLVAEVRDDGRGLQPEGDTHDGTVEGESGNGLRNMRARAAALGAKLTIDSAPGNGTAIVLAVPAQRLRRSTRPHEHAVAPRWRRR